MDGNPYAPPKAGLEPAAATTAATTAETVDAAAGGPRPLSAEVEARAMQALGQRRSRAGARSFAIAWPVSVAILMLGLGFIPALIVGSIVGGVFSKMYVKARKAAMVEAVSRELGISPGAFAPDKYLID